MPREHQQRGSCGVTNGPIDTNPTRVPITISVLGYTINKYISPSKCYNLNDYPSGPTKFHNSSSLHSTSKLNQQSAI